MRGIPPSTTYDSPRFQSSTIIGQALLLTYGHGLEPDTQIHLFLHFVLRLLSERCCIFFCCLSYISRIGRSTQYTRFSLRSVLGRSQFVHYTRWSQPHGAGAGGLFIILSPLFSYMICRCMGEHALEGTWLVRPEGYCSPVRSSTLVLRTSRHPWGDEGGRHTTRELRHPACWYNVFSHVVASGRSG